MAVTGLGSVSSPTSGDDLVTLLQSSFATQTGGVRKVTGPTLPTFASGIQYVWEKTDASTGQLVDIITGTVA